MRIEFSDKVALVTGAGSGIGAASSLAFAEAGARVVCVDIDAAAGTATAQRITAGGGTALFVQADVTRAEDVQRYVAATLNAFGRIDAFANNAGYLGVVLPLTDYPDEVFDRVMAVNVRGVFLGLKRVLPIMKAQRSGAIVNTGSSGSHVGAPGVAAYIASKHAVLGLTRTAALEAAPFGVCVNAICPGGTDTRMLEVLSSARAESAESPFNVATPNGRVARPEEIAAAILYMCSDHARHMIGQSLILDGGRLAI